MLLNSGVMQHTTPRHPVLALLLLTATLGSSLTPGRASADAPNAVQAASAAAVQVARAISTQALVDGMTAKPIVQPRPPILASGSLVKRVTDVLQNGVLVASGVADGKLYLDFEKHGLGGVLCLRYRR